MRRAPALLVAAILAVLPAATKKPDVPASERQFHLALTKDQRLTHAVERLSFGARPGDFDRVRQMGIDRWIDQQLHPERIPENPILEEKLRPLASLGMDNGTLVRNYPPPQ